MPGAENKKPIDEAKNPFSGGLPGQLGAGGQSAADLATLLAKARRAQFIQLLAAVLLMAAIAGGACYYIQQTWQAAEQRLLSTQRWSNQSGQNAVQASANFALWSSNYAAQSRLAQSQAAFSMEQARRDRDAVLALKVEAATTVTNAVAELTRRMGRQLTELAQTNMMALDLNYAARLKSLDDEIERQRQELQRVTVDKLKLLNRELSKYDALLKLDPDVAGRIDAALKQLKQLVDITELLKLREEDDVKSINNQLAILTEKLKVLELRLGNLQQAVGNPAPAARPATNPPPSKPGI